MNFTGSMRNLAPLLLLLPTLATAQLGATRNHFTRADTLRGSNGPYRAWWDVTHYDITVKPDLSNKRIQGRTCIRFRTLASGQRMQVDLQQPLSVTSIRLVDPSGEQDVRHTREGHVIWVDLPQELPATTTAALIIDYAGTPREARSPPWDGGWIWKHDAHGAPWASVACQGLGASVWYPCKDIQSDEPDSAALHITVPDSLQAVGNGRLRSTTPNGDGTSTWTWATVNPINSYNIIPSIGRYGEVHEVYAGLDGPLDIAFWALRDHVDQAREQFRQVPLMLACFEDWFGPYPFYADGYKLVEAPHLGMEHQSAIAYGNQFRNGYLGSDLSGTGWGLKWDYIIIHESAHEWFGNNITSADIADMWVHEAFTDYAETIYTQCRFGEAAGNEYVAGLRQGIQNDVPVTGPYGVNQEGSSDMYGKGANLLHLIRHLMNDDAKFKAMLRAMNQRFRHAIVTGAEVEAFLSGQAGMDLSNLLDQYLRTTQVPVLQWGVLKDDLKVRWADCVNGFAMPVLITVNGDERRVEITDRWTSPAHGLKERSATLAVDMNWYVTTERLSGKALKKALNDAH